VAPDSQVGRGGPSSLFYKVEASGKHILSVLMDSRRAFPSCADQQNAAVGVLQERCHERSLGDRSVGASPELWGLGRRRQVDKLCGCRNLVILFCGQIYS
jgi:hypothetical protein